MHAESNEQRPAAGRCSFIVVPMVRQPRSVNIWIFFGAQYFLRRRRNVDVEAT